MMEVKLNVRKATIHTYLSDTQKNVHVGLSRYHIPGVDIYISESLQV